MSLRSIRVRLLWKLHRVFERRLFGRGKGLEMDLRRPSGVACPACLHEKTETIREVPYYWTHLHHWNPSLSDFMTVVEPGMWGATFELRACPECELIFVPESRRGFTDRVEEHPLFIEKTAKPYLDLFQNEKIDAKYVRRLESDEANMAPHLQLVIQEARMLARHLGAGSRFLDVGCNQGAFPAVMMELLSDVEVWGCEINPTYARRCRERYPKLSLIDEPLAAQGEPLFDVVSCVGVIEHIWDLDDFVSGIRGRLASGGKVFIRTPDTACFESRKLGYHWWAYLIPHHCQLFAQKSLDALMARHGLERTGSGSSAQEFWTIYTARSAEDSSCAA